ncbi:MAG: FliG C-terminal domain-containing protein [Blastopirellula sp. JB062]
MTQNIDQQMIRKAAIVVAELDPDAADALLDAFPEEIAQQVRYESLLVEDVSAEERRTVLAEFMQRRSGEYAAPADEKDELVLSSGARIDSAQPPAPKRDHLTESATPPPFHFLNEAPPEMLAPFFEQESPQVIAVVLSHLEAVRASEILRQLPVDLQASVIQRLVDLGQTDAEVLRDIESRLQDIVQEQLQAMSHRRMGLTAAKAILAASDERNAAEVLKTLKTRSAEMAMRLGVDEKTPVAQPKIVVAPPVEPQAMVADHLAVDEATKKSSPLSAVSAAAQPSIPLADFVKFDDVLLGRILAETEPQTVLLALAGAANAVTQRFYRGLSKREIHDLQRRIRDLQPVLIRDIDAAQKQLGVIASRVIQQGRSQVRQLSASA